MAEGYERREDVKDPNAQSNAGRPATVPLSLVMSPRPSSFSRVGQTERQLAEALGKAPIGLSKYLDKKQEEWQLEGQMAYAEGKTEEEIARTGNRYTMAGFMSMKARTAGNEWLQQALTDIDDGDRMLESGQYQAKLKEQYKALTESVAGQDSYTRNLMSSMAAEMFPKLVSQQVVSNNAWREDETASSYTSMLVSEASTSKDPNALMELLDQKVSGLPAERHRQSVIDAIKLSGDEDNTVLLDSLGWSMEEKLSSLEGEAGLPANLLSAVIQQESGGRRYDKDGNVLTSPAGAKGEMQVMDGTNVDPGFGVVPAQDNSLEERARVGRDYLAAMYDRYNGDLEATLVAYNAGPGNADKFVAAGKDYDVLPKKSETLPYVKNIMSDLSDATGVKPKRNSVTAALLKQGFTPAQITTLSSTYESVKSRKAQEFNKDRELWERNLQKQVEVYGNLPEALDMIETKMTEEGYDDTWATGMATKVMSSMNAYEKEHRTTLEIEGAISTGRVATLDSKNQKKAIDLERARVIEIVTSQQSLPNEQKGEMIRQHMADFVTQNKVVDKMWASNLQLDLTNITGPDGEVRPESVQAFSDYMLLAEKSNAGFASKYLDEDTKKLVAIAESYTIGGYMNAGQALQQAHEIRSRQQSGQFHEPKPISDKLLTQAVDEIVDTVDPFWFGWRNDKTRAFEVYDSELDQARNNPVLRGMVKQYAYNHMLLDPNLTPKAAALLARNDIQERAEYAMGNILLSGPTSSIRADMGIQDWTDPKTVDKVMLDYLRQYGETIWGSEFNETQIFGQGKEPGFDGVFDGGLVPDLDPMWQSMKDAARGVPQMSIRYDADRKGFIVDRWLDKERTALANTPHFVPASELGDWARNSENGTLNPVNQAAWYDPRPNWMRKKNDK